MIKVTFARTKNLSFEEMRILIKYSLICLFISVIAETNTNAQIEGKYELRATWVATVANIDWPAKIDRGKPEVQKADLIRMLDLYRSVNLNAIFLQVRTECDAFYNSAYEPWSRYLSVAQGDYPGYDPLQFAIEEAHKRGIEVHAWVNPYRINASTSPGADYFHPTHVFIEHPEWAIAYPSGKLILNPGIPEVMSYIGDVVRDLCSNYNIDGVHFDDYFYSYEGTDAALDADEYALYNNGMSLSDWRRDNVNRMIDTVYTNINKVNPNIRFGVSPFGIYRPGIPTGIIGMDAYKDIYCDPLAWLEDQTVDYLTPQLYWPTGGGQDFETLANWWADQCWANGRPLAPGHGLYRFSASPDLKKSFDFGVDEDKKYFDVFMDSEGQTQDLSSLEKGLKKSTSDPIAAWTLSQLGLQIDIVRSRSTDGAFGSVFYSANDWEEVNRLAEYIVLNKYTHPAIIPEMTWKAVTTPDIPINLNESAPDGIYQLNWDYTGGINDRFAIYTSIEDIDSSQIILNPNNLKHIVFDNNIELSQLDFSKNSFIVITAISAIGKEGLPSSRYRIKTIFPEIELLSPDNGASVSRSTNLEMNCADPNPEYSIEISTNFNFSSLIYESEWSEASQISLNDLPLPGEVKYYWRGKARTNVEEGFYCDKREFTTLYPATPAIEYPGHLEQKVSIMPRVMWSASTAAQNITVEISDTDTFTNLFVNETFSALEGSGKITGELTKDSWYYIRLKASNASGHSEYSEANIFKTTDGNIPEVRLLNPASGTNVSSFDLFQWESTSTEGTITFLMEIALDANFNSILSNSGWISAEEIQASNLNLEGQRNYYWRVRAKNDAGMGEYSETRQFFAAYPPRPSINSPVQLSEGNPVMTELLWTVGANTDSIYFEFSEDGNFESINYSESFIAVPNNNTIHISLREYTWYFLRAAAKNEFGYSIFSGSKYYKTGIGNDIEQEKSSAEIVKVFPNPLIGEYLFVQVNNEDIQNLHYTIYDSYGKELISLAKFQKNTDRSSSLFIRRNLFGGEGIYFIKVSGGEFVVVKPIIIVE